MSAGTDGAAAGRWLHAGCGGTVVFGISGGYCTGCEAEDLGEGEYFSEDEQRAADLRAHIGGMGGPSPARVTDDAAGVTL